MQRMIRNAGANGWSSHLDALAVGSLASTLVIAVGVGGNGSAVIRAVVQMLSLATLLLLLSGMIARRRWTFVPSPLWVVALFFICLPVLQLTLPPPGGSLKAPG